MHKQVVIVGAGPSGLLLARMLANRGVDTLILENRNLPFLRLQNRGGVLQKDLVDVLEKEKASTKVKTNGLSIDAIDIKVMDTTTTIASTTEAYIYDQKNLVADMIEGLQADGVEIKYEAKAQRYEGLEGDTVRIVYTYDGQIYDVTCDFVVGCDGYRGISRRSIPRDDRNEVREELPIGWLEWIAEDNTDDRRPIMAYHASGFAMRTPNANGQTRYYLQVERGVEMDDLPSQDALWDTIEERLGVAVTRGEMLHMKLDYMRYFYTELLQHGRLFIAGDAAHQCPRLGSKGMHMALADAASLAIRFGDYYNNNDDAGLNNYSQDRVKENVQLLAQAKQVNGIFHMNDGIAQADQVEELQSLLTDKKKKEALVKYLIG